MSVCGGGNPDIEPRRGNVAQWTNFGHGAAVRAKAWFMIQMDHARDRPPL